MKKKNKAKWIHLFFLIIGVIAITEIQIIAKRQAIPCVDGACHLPPEKAGAIVGPQNVPIFPSEQPLKPQPQLLCFDQQDSETFKMMEIVLTTLSQDTSNHLRVRFIDTHASREMADQYSISSTPTQIFLDADGCILFRNEGFITERDILKKWAELDIELSVDAQ